MNTKQERSRKGAKAQRPAKSSRPPRRGHIFARLCVLAPLREITIIILLIALSFPAAAVSAQTTTASDLATPQAPTSLSRYLDQTQGTTADEAVAYALAHNAELEAARKEIDAARAMVKQARLPPK